MPFIAIKAKIKEGWGDRKEKGRRKEGWRVFTLKMKSCVILTLN